MCRKSSSSSLQQMAFEELYSRLQKEGSLPLFTRIMVTAGMFWLRLRKMCAERCKDFPPTCR